MDVVTCPEADAGWRDLSALLRDSGYSVETVRKVLGLDEPVETVVANIGRYSFMYLEELAGMNDPAAVLAQLLLLSGQVPADDVRRLDPALRDLLWRLELIEPDVENPRLVHGTVSITELEGRYFVSDKLFENRLGEFVVHGGVELCMPPHASSLELLAALQTPIGARSFLDVGCGTGCQSILAASGYDYVTGFDPNPRSVMFARVNSLLNDVSARYTVDGWESFQDGERYDHVAFNSPDCDVAFAFIDSGMGRVLADSGCAQVWLTCEVTEEDGDLAAVLHRRIRNLGEWRVDKLVNVDSPFSLAPESVRSRQLPPGTLLVSHPAEKAAYFDGLAERRVTEVVSTTLTLRR